MSHRSESPAAALGLGLANRDLLLLLGEPHLGHRAVEDLAEAQGALILLGVLHVVLRRGKVIINARVSVLFCVCKRASIRYSLWLTPSTQTY